MNTDNDFRLFRIKGSDFRNAIQKLKPAFPKKKQVPYTSVTFTVHTHTVEIGLPGAAVEASCDATDEFQVRIPFVELKAMMKYTWSNKDIIELGFAPGKLSFGKLIVTSPGIDIVVDVNESPKEKVASKFDDWQIPLNSENTPNAAILPGIPDGLSDLSDSPIGFPLIGAYKLLRQYPDPAMEIYNNPQIRAGRKEIEALLKLTYKSLQPLGVSQEEIYHWLDKHTGLTD